MKSVIFTSKLLNMKHILLSLLLLPSAFVANAQTNIHFTNSAQTNVLAGNYNPGAYSSSAISDPHEVAVSIEGNIRPDYLRASLEQMSAFETRNTGSDTVSTSRGIGAARKWAHDKFQEISDDNDNRLEVGYLSWERNICDVDKHKNIVAVLPGSSLGTTNTTAAGIVIVEAHFDSRCATGCDTTCQAHGMEDNGSGSALVLELARVMAPYQFERTIVFMLTVAEEQGLYGAQALADYCVNHSIEVAAVLNNDIVGGVICGETSSPPSCPTENEVDSTQVRLFSSGTVFSANKQLARYIKKQYQDELETHVDVPMALTIMSAEDRTGRGGDHIPFRQRGFAAMRFTSANEHGDGNPSQTGYHDRQHTSDDILGEDTNNDGTIDKWYVDFNYLARNAAINANAAVMLGQNVCAPAGIAITQTDWKTLHAVVEDGGCDYEQIALGVRSETNDWDTVIYSAELETSFDIEPGHTYFVSAALVDDHGVESLFTQEDYKKVVGVDEVLEHQTGIELLQNRPNPFDEATSIAFIIHEMPSEPMAQIQIRDLGGAIVFEQNVEVKLGVNEIIYDHGYGKTGTFLYSLLIDREPIDTKKMVFVAN
ncbi:M28 family peptidase [Salibacteraceae bacterium]|nr:M28 family peptidase [Salibacteraceae bacterium]